MNGLFVRINNQIADRNERGAAMAEYGLLLALVALGAMLIMSLFGETLAETFGLANDTIVNSPAGPGGAAN